MSFVIVVLLISFVGVSFFAGRIPNTGRDGKASGERITAVITNTNKTADSAVTLRAEKDGRKFKVKMKPTEAHLWIQGDEIDIVLNDNNKGYRVLFNDYFRENEKRIREKAVEKLARVNSKLVAARIVHYTDDMFEQFKNSNLESQRIFAFTTYMRFLDIYSILAAVFAVAVLVWRNVASPDFEDMLLPIAVILIMLWMLYSANTICKRIIKEVVKTEEKPDAKKEKN